MFLNTSFLQTQRIFQLTIETNYGYILSALHIILFRTKFLTIKHEIPGSIVDLFTKKISEVNIRTLQSRQCSII